MDAFKIHAIRYLWSMHDQWFKRGGGEARRQVNHRRDSLSTIHQHREACDVHGAAHTCASSILARTRSRYSGDSKLNMQNLSVCKSKEIRR